MLRKKCNPFVLLLIVELLVILVLLPGCFRQEKRIGLFYGEDLQALATQADNHIEVCGNQMTLTPGVYRLRVQTKLLEEQSLYVEMKCEYAYFKALRTNGITVLPCTDSADVTVFVLDKVPTAYVYCEFYGVSTDGLVQLEIYKTGMGNRMLLFIVLAFFGALDFMLGFRRQILEGRITHRQQAVFWTLAAGILIAYFPYLTDYFSFGADSLFHWSRIAFLKNSLLQGGGFPVRVQSTWLNDHGYAVSLFYGDLFLYIPALLQIIGFSVMTAYKMFVLLILAATALVSYFSIKKCVKDEYAALFGSMIYLLVPYHIFNVYSRGALGECLAMIFLPLVCCGMYLLYTEDVTSEEYKKYKWYVIWGMSGVLQSHIISTEMTVLLMAIFCAVFWKKTFRRKTFYQLLQTAIIALLLNMWFWLPLLYMMKSDAYLLDALPQGEIQSRGILFAGLFQWLPNKGNAQNGMYDCEPVQVGAAVYILLSAYALRRRRTGKKDTPCTAFAVFSVATIVMSTRYLPWNAIAKLPWIGYVVSSLQFPSRWMVPATVFAAFFAAFFFLQTKENGGTLLRTVVGIAAAVTVVSAVYHVNSIAFEAAPVYLYDAGNMGTKSVGNGEYLLAGTQVSEFSYHEPTAEEGLIWSDYEKNGTNIRISLHNTTDGIRYLELPLIGYKGYHAASLLPAAAETELPYITEERGAHGDLRLAVPAGYQGEISVAYKGFAVFHVAEAVSLVSLLSGLGIYLYRKRKRE